ncbi:hypothetical protein XELAEV_18036502mg [Xenopus laevis]|uniref:Uncharacterized protein n=1 Tax=Xenopus laevis TaxID=8355 RepID=A0A974CHL2_XENLA|nr:hypothetical protein XELAEV_18036502mg [Xenopus laevis]
MLGMKALNMSVRLFSPPSLSKHFLIIYPGTVWFYFFFFWDKMILFE